jgi:hypothetical protein
MKLLITGASCSGRTGGFACLSSDKSTGETACPTLALAID